MDKLKNVIILITTVALCSCGMGSRDSASVTEASTEKVSEIVNETKSEPVPDTMRETTVIEEKVEVMEETEPENSSSVDSQMSLNWEWVIEPTIETAKIENIPRGYTYLHDPIFDTFWHSKYFYIENDDGEKAVIDIDGNILSKQIFNSIYYCWSGCALYDRNNYDDQNRWKGEGAGCVLNDDGTLSDMEYVSEVFQQTTNGSGWYYYTDDSYDSIVLYFDCGITYRDPFNVVLTLPKIELEKDDRGIYHPEENFTLFENEKYALIVDDKPITDFIYEDGGHYVDGIIPMKNNGKWGYLDRDGKTVIPFEYDGAWVHDYPYASGKAKAKDASEGYVVLSKNGGYALYTTENEPVIDFGEFSYITSPYRGKCWVQDSSGKWGVIRIKS